VKTLRSVTMLPSSTIQRRGDDAFVYLLRDGRAHAQVVKVGVVDADMTQVDGIAPGAAVANSSFEKLQDGAPIKITNTPMLPPTSGPPPSGPSPPSENRSSIP
jgi:multidrug efflux system membrane fusion protein